jgi:hypothetical protein
MRLSEIKLKKGDCSSSTARPWRLLTGDELASAVDKEEKDLHRDSLEFLRAACATEFVRDPV